MKNGSRFKSQVDDTQVIVVKWTDTFAELRCGGHPMVPIDAESAELALVDALADGTAMGKRYVAADGGEVLVTKAGRGTLAVAETPLTVKEAKPLPASD